jgi:predicted RNase H-like HicB family nuclease
MSETMRFEVLLEPDEDGGFHVWCPQLSGSHSHGEAREEAIEHIREAAETWLEGARELGIAMLDRDVITVPTAAHTVS